MRGEAEGTEFVCGLVSGESNCCFGLAKTLLTISTTKRQEAIATGCSRGNPNGLKEKKKITARQFTQTGTVCAERLQNFHPFHFLSACGRQTLSSLLYGSG